MCLPNSRPAGFQESVTTMHVSAHHSYHSGSNDLQQCCNTHIPTCVCNSRPAEFQESATTTHVSVHHSYHSGSNDGSGEQAPPLPPASHHQALPPPSNHQPLQIQHHHQQVPQQAASSATKELDELMASLSEFKVRTLALALCCDCR